MSWLKKVDKEETEKIEKEDFFHIPEWIKKRGMKMFKDKILNNPELTAKALRFSKDTILEFMESEKAIKVAEFAKILNYQKEQFDLLIQQGRTELAIEMRGKIHSETGYDIAIYTEAELIKIRPYCILIPMDNGDLRFSTMCNVNGRTVEISHFDYEKIIKENLMRVTELVDKETKGLKDEE